MKCAGRRASLRARSRDDPGLFVPRPRGGTDFDLPSLQTVKNIDTGIRTVPFFNPGFLARS